MQMMLDGKLVDEREAVVSVFDHGFMYGIGLFETFRTYGGEPFLLDRHLQRLEDGCAELRFRITWTEADIREQIARLMSENHLTDGYFLLSVSAGTGPLGVPGADDSYDQPRVLIYVKEVAPPLPFAARPHKTLQLLQLRRNSPEGSRRRKSFHYMNNLLGKWEASGGRAPHAEGIYLNEREQLTECVTSNLFFMKDGTLHTPAIETGILSGVTRRFVIELAIEQGLHVSEGFYSFEQLITADEVFVTNSIQEIVAVSELLLTDESAISFKPGMITDNLAAAYERARG